MKTSILHDARVDFDQRNAVLYVALGVVSARRRFDRLLARYAPASGVGGDPTRLAADERAALDLVLGLIAVSQHLQRYGALARRDRPLPFQPRAGLLADESDESLKPRDLLAYRS